MGVSNKNAQDIHQPKGNKKDLKNLQVLYASKRSQPRSQEVDNEQAIVEELKRKYQLNLIIKMRN